MAECARRLGDQFVSYRTSAAADDIDSVREALGYETIALYGDSYGTFLAQSYAYRHGDRLDALVLDSAYPAFGEDPWYPSLPRTGIRSLGLACDRAPGCEGDAIARLEEGVETLREQRRPVIDAVTALIDASGSPPESYLQLDRALSDLVDGDPTAWEKLISPARVGDPERRPLSDGRPVDRELQRLPDDLGQVRVGARAPGTARGGDRRVPPGRLRAVHHARDRVFARAPHTSPASPSPPPTDVYEPPVDPETQEPTEAPVLVVSGEMDDITTPSEGRTVASFFPDSEWYLARNAGHVDALYAPNGPAGTEIREFLADALDK